MSIVIGQEGGARCSRAQVSGLTEIGPKISFVGDLVRSGPAATIEHMLTPSLIAPVGLQATIAETRRVQGAHGVVDLIVLTMTSRRLGSDADIDEHLAVLKAACRQTRRYREALPVLHRVATLNPDRRHEMAAEIALVHWHLGERSLAVATLETAVAQQRSLPPWKRSLAFSLVAEIAATVVGRSDLAAVCAQLGRSTVTPAPRRAPAATKARTAAKANTPNEPALAGWPTVGASVGRRRAKGPVRQLSVLSSANQPNLAEVDTEIRVAKAGHPRLTMVDGAAA